MNGRLGRTMIAAMAAALLAASTASAGPADLDPSFGTNGLVLVPAGDRFDPQSAPLLRTDAQVTLAGLLRNSSDRVFLSRFDEAGQLAPGFGAGGEVHTNVIGAPGRRAAVAAAPGGKIVVAGGFANKASITLERYNADGSPDGTFGSNGKLTATITGSYLQAASALVLPDGRTVVSAYTDHGGSKRAFVLMRFTDKRLDTSFDKDGVARVAFGDRNATAWDIAAYPVDRLGNAQILAAGSAGDAADTDLALARLNHDGSLDKTFGGNQTGTVERSTAGAGKADHATGVVLDPGNGGLFVTGPADGRGMVARFGNGGVLDAGFAAGGIQLGGFTPAGTSFAPADVVLDSQNRLVVAGSAGTRELDGTTTTRWAAARLQRSGAAPLDAGWAGGGAALLDVCTNKGGYGPTGAAVAGNGRIVILGACGAAGRVAAVRLFGTDAFPTQMALEVLDQDGQTPSLAEAGGPELVPLSRIDPSSVLGAVTNFATTTLGSGPMGSGPMGSGPMGSGPMGSGPMGSGPMGSGPMGSGPMGSGPMGSGPMGSGPMGSGPLADQVLISQLPLLTPPSWEERLAPVYAPDPVPPLQTITLGDVYRKSDAGRELVDSLTYGDVDVSRTPLRHASLASVMLTRPLQYVAAPPGAGSPRDRWCAYLAGQPLNCDNGVDLAATTLLALEFAGDDLSDYYSNPLSLLASAGTDLGTRGVDAATLAYLDLRQVDISRTVLRDRPASEFAPLLACGATGSCSGTLAQQQQGAETTWTTATIGELVDFLNANPGLGDLSLGQLLVGMVHTGEIPYEQAPANALLAAAELRGDDLQMYRSTFELDCEQSRGLVMVPALADDARVIPGSGRVTIGTGEPQTILRRDDGTFDLTAVCGGRTGVHTTRVTFLAEPGSRLRAGTSSVTVRSAFGQISRSVPVAVDDSRDAGDEPTDTKPLTTDKIVHGWISTAGDADYYRFPSPAPGTRISITLSHLPADFDLTLFSPGGDIDASSVRSGPMGSGPMGSGPMGSGPVPDSTADAVDPLIVEPDTVQDLPMGSGPMGSGPMGSGPMGSGSINRGTADEAITYVVRQSDVGKDFYVRVHGYNGETSEFPFVLRRMDLEPPESLPCPARDQLIHNLVAHGSAPQEVPADTQTLYLVNSQRLAALNEAGEAGKVMEGLSELAAQAGPSKGVVVPVDSDADVRDAYVDWDKSPCEEELANNVVERINALVDRLRARPEADGLRQLRSIVLVGPDAVVPQARVRDDSWLSNEFEYARDARLNTSQDDAVSGALNDGYMTTDQAYGDLDAGRTIFVPDVALGRLVETASEISGQIERFLDRGGLVTPQDAVVMGYELFEDGAQAQAAAFGVQAEVGNWDATKAVNAMNRATTGFTAVNAHYDHFRGLPAAAFTGLGAPNLFSAGQASPQPDSILFTMGCHSGLNIAVQNGAGPATVSQERLGDWAQRMAQRQAPWTGSTSYSYGDTETVAYTESILAEMATMLAGRQVTVGQALMYAQHRSIATVGVLDRYYVKSSLALTLYGLPMWRLSENGVGAPGMPELDYELTAGTLTSQPLSFDLSGAHLQRHDTDRGSWWQADGEAPLVVQNHPVQPLATKAAPAGSGNAKGYLIEGLKTEDVENVNPVIARPTVDLGAHEPEPPARVPYFPARLASVTTEATPEGRRDRVTVAAGQFRGDRQRLFRSISGRVLFATGDRDEHLAIRRVHGEVSEILSGPVVTGHRFSVRVETEGATPRGGNVLYRTSADRPDANGVITWHRANLAVGLNGLLWTGGVLPGGDKIEEAFVQVYSTTNTIAHSNFKVVGYSFEEVLPRPGDPRILLDPEIQGEGYLKQVPSVILDPGGRAGARFECRFDGGAWQTVSPLKPFEIPNPKGGEHLVECRGDDGSSTRRQFGVDLDGPQVLAELDRAPDHNGWYTKPVTVSFHCADDVSGVATCPEPRTIDTEGTLTVAGTATDLAGRSGSSETLTLKVDLTAPTITAVQREPDHNGWYTSPVAVDFQCEDTVSGVADCTGDRTVDTETTPEGVRLEGVARDQAGHTATAATTAKVDLNDPVIRAVPDRGPDHNGWYTKEVTVTFEECSDSASGVIACPAPETVDTNGRSIRVERTIGDHAGRTGTGGITLKMDKQPPNVTIDEDGIVFLDEEQVEGTATDLLGGNEGFGSGVRRVTVSFQNDLLPGEPITRHSDEGGAVTLTCDGDRDVCTWSTPPPPVGQWTVTAQAIDFAGWPSKIVRQTISVRPS